MTITLSLSVFIVSYVFPSAAGTSLGSNLHPERVVGHVHVRRKRRFGGGLPSDVVRHVRQVRLARSDTANQLQRLLHVEMRVMRLEAQRIDHQHLHAEQLLLLGPPIVLKSVR